jgi:FixJ family two-component response regulator
MLASLAQQKREALKLVERKEVKKLIDYVLVNSVRTVEVHRAQVMKN